MSRSAQSHRRGRYCMWRLHECGSGEGNKEVLQKPSICLVSGAYDTSLMFIVEEAPSLPLFFWFFFLPVGPERSPPRIQMNPPCRQSLCMLCVGWMGGCGQKGGGWTPNVLTLGFANVLSRRALACFPGFHRLGFDTHTWSKEARMCLSGIVDMFPAPTPCVCMFVKLCGCPRVRLRTCADHCKDF
jgi:hypothetical protein